VEILNFRALRSDGTYRTKGTVTYRSYESHRSYSFLEPRNVSLRTTAVTLARTFAPWPISRDPQSPTLASVCPKLFPDCRDQEAILAANHLRAEITDTADGFSPIMQSERYFESNVISVSLIRNIDQRRT
jgi:hypothetical protein